MQGQCNIVQILCHNANLKLDQGWPVLAKTLAMKKMMK